MALEPLGELVSQGKTEMIQDFWNALKGQTVLIVGNGPSLDKTPLEKLAQKYQSFGANKIYDSLNHPDFIPDFWTCVDNEMLDDCIPFIQEHPEFNPIKFVPRTRQFKGANLLNVKIGEPVSADASEYVVLGGTVTIVNLQLAYFMGATTALLVGVDHNYPRRGYDGAPGSKFVGDGEDLGHFQSKTGAYFSKGKTYNRPEIDATGSISYPAVGRVWKADGRKIINLTPGTKLDAFEKQDFRKWL